MTFLNCNSDWSILIRKIFRISLVNSTQNEILLCIRTKITWDFCVDVFVDCIDSSNNLIPGSSLYLAVDRELWKPGCPFCRVTCLSMDKAHDFVIDGFPKNPAYHRGNNNRQSFDAATLVSNWLWILRLCFRYLPKKFLVPQPFSPVAISHRLVLLKKAFISEGNIM